VRRLEIHSWRVAHLDAILATVVGAAASAAVFHRLEISAWFDEAYSFGMATQSWQSYVTRWFWGAESNMALYYVILRGWLGFLSLFGVAPSEVLLRLPSALGAIGAAVTVYFLGRRVFGRIAGLVGAGLFLANFLEMILAQNARAYSLEMLLLCLSWLALFAALEEDSKRWWAVYVAAGTLSVWATLFSGLVLVSQVVALVMLLVLPGPWQAHVRNSIRSAVVSLAVTFVLVLPIGVDAVLHGGPVWVPPAQLSDLRALLLLIDGGSRNYERLVLASAGLAFVLAAAAIVPRLARLTLASRSTLGAAAAMGSWLVVPIAISFALTRPGLNLHLFFPRYLVVVVPPLCLLAALAVEALPSRVLQLALAIALAVVAWQPFTFYYQLAQVQDFKDPVQWIQQRYQAGDGMVCEPAVQCGIPVAYYLQADPGPARIDRDSPGRFSWEDSSSVPVTKDTLLAYAGHHRRIFFVFAPLGQSPALDSEAASLEAELTADGFHLIETVSARATAATVRVDLFEATAGGA
jgi:mannosyltransferase